MTNLRSPDSGVNPKLYSAYSFADHIWSQPHTARPDLLELARRCVKIGEVYWLKRAGRWTAFRTLTDASHEAESTWLYGKLSSGNQVDAALIKAFFSGEEEKTHQIGTKTVTSKTKVGACPNLDGRIVVPFGPLFVEYDAARYLNTWVAGGFAEADEQYARLAKVVLRLIYRSLCDGPCLNEDGATEADMLLQQVQDNAMPHLEFNFAMNWLAALYQRPGINLQTNLWLCGELQGIGKGTLCEIMRAVLGATMVGHLDQTEIEAGYTDHLIGYALLVSNEFCADMKWSRNRWNKWVKGQTTENVLTGRARYDGAFRTLNIGNYMFTTNERNPAYMDATDRRNFLVQTTDDPYWQNYASLLKSGLLEQGMPNVAAGFAWILAQVEIDLPLIQSAPLTALKADNQSESRSPVEEWLENSQDIQRDQPVRSEELYQSYRSWVDDNCPRNTPLLSITGWGRAMRGLAKRGVTKVVKTSGAYYQVPTDMLAVVRSPGTRAAAGNEIAAITGEAVIIVDHDAVIPDTGGETSAPSQMDRVRAAVREGYPDVVPFN
jgi:Family of unknown function (DUF5906)